jgi:hypothetical protein
MLQMNLLNLKKLWAAPMVGLTTLTLTNCVPMSGSRSGSMGMSEITPQMRQLDISGEPRGDFFYARRYFVEKTRFWGYVRKPGQPWSGARLVVMNEDSAPQPDRKSETGPESSRHGYDQNYTYRINGYYTGRDIYEPASNLFLPEFKANSYSVVQRDSGWLFTPNDYYNKTQITLVNGSIARPVR